jgi:hypothetical protein
VRRHLRRRFASDASILHRHPAVAVALVIALFGGLLTSSLAVAPPAEAATAVCNAAVEQNGITVSPSHSTVFYVDSASSQRMDASYLGYVVSSTTARSDLWVSVGGFAGGSVVLADPADAVRSLGSLSASASQTAYFLVKATTPSSRAQTHTVTVHSGMPGLASSTELATCSFSFAQVKETIKANANKVSAVTTSPASTAGLSLGQTFTVTVEGDTGLIGEGTSSPDRDMMWLSPAARSSWPAGSIRLESTRIRLGSTLAEARACTSESTCQFSNVLLLKNLKTLANSIKRNARSLSYVATYTFRVVGATSTAVPIIPVAQVSSGIQIKHTTIPATALASLSTDDIVVNARATKTVSTTVTVTPDPLSTTLHYTLAVANLGSTAITIDRLNDDADPLLHYVAGSVVGRTVTALGVQSTLAVRAPSAATATGVLTFTGPLSVPAGGRIELDYAMTSPTCVENEPFTATNSATAEIGTTIIGSSASTFQRVLASGTCGDPDLEPPVITDETIEPEVATLPPSAVGDTTATLEATVDPNGVAGASMRFEWGTNADFRGAASVSMGLTGNQSTPQAVAGGLTGLQSGTLYYYRIVVDAIVEGAARSYVGSRQSFVTTEPAAAPVVTTLPATAVSTAGATLNATIDPNQTASLVAFAISKTSTLPDASTTRVTIRDDQDTAYNVNSNPYTTFSGSFAVPVDLALAQAGVALTPGDTWYYRADIVSSSGAVLSSGTIRSVSLVTTAPQSVAFDPVDDTLITAGSTSARAVASSGLAPSIRTETPSVCRVDTNDAGIATLVLLDVGDCTLVANQDGGTVGGTVYEPAPTTSTTFTVARAPRTLALGRVDDLADWSVAGPLLVAVPSAGVDDGVVTYRRVDGAGVCLVDTLTGEVTVVGPGTCRIAATVSTGSRHETANSSSVSFTVGVRSQQLTLPNATLSLSSTGLDLDADSTATSFTEGLPGIAYALVADDENSAGCTIVAGRISAASRGTCLVEATRGGNAYWTSASTRALITVNDKAPRAIVLRTPGADGPVAVPSSIDDWSTTELDVIGVPSETDEADTITYTTLPGTTACTVDGASGAVRITGAGDCVLRTSVSETPARTGATSGSVTIRIGQRVQRITEFADGEVLATAEGLALSSGTDATTNVDGLGDPRYVIAEGSTVGCTIVSGQVRFTQAGTCIVAVSRSGNAHWKAAEAQATITVNRASRAIVFAEATAALAVPDWSARPHQSVATPSAGSGDGVITYRASSPTGACSTSATTGLVEFAGAGECTLDAEVSTGARYGAAQAASVSFTIGKRTQAITGLDDDTVAADLTELSLAAVSDATVNDTGMEEVSLELIDGDDGACRIDGGGLLIDGAGSCIVEASRPGNAHWTAATQRATVTIERVARTLTVTDRRPTPLTWSTAAPTLSTTVSAGATEASVRFGTAEGSACSVDAVTGTLTLLRAGTCTVTGALGETRRYTGANAEPYSFTIGPVTQRITGLPSARAALSIGSLPLAARSNASTLAEGIGPIVYAASGACATEGDALQLLRAGTCTVTATREGNDNWTTALTTSEFVIDPLGVTGRLRLQSGRSALVVGQRDVALLTTSPEHPGRRSWTTATGACSVDAEGAVRALAAGSCTVIVVLPATDRLTGATSRLTVPVSAAPVEPSPPPVVPSPPPTVPSPPPTVPPAPPEAPEEDTAGSDATLRDAISVRTLPELGRESMAGFAPNSAVRADIAGARTVGQFIVAGSGLLDRSAVIGALEESIARRSGSFTRVVDIAAGNPNGARLVSSIVPAFSRLFAETRLGTPRAVGDLGVDEAQRWVTAVVDVSGMRPGSPVALAVTSEPIIIGQAVAGPDGAARVTGWIPLDQLEPGAHSLRVVGVRQLQGAVVDDRGEVRMTPEIIAQVAELDPGTAATLTIAGSTAGDDTLIAQRRVLIDDNTPWWSLLLLTAGVIGVAAARRASALWTRGRRAGSLVVIGALVIVVAVAGWYTAAYGIYGVAAVIATLGVVIALASRRPQRRQSS